MTYEECMQTKKQVKAILNQPQDTWRNALAAIGIPADVANRAAQNERLVAIYLYLDLCVPSGLQTQKAHYKAERSALMTITNYLNRYENGKNYLYI